ncbi:MAG: triphosphoribosyl-dephospho-CoA synthase CitG [Oscillospiraceae bacterium]
MNEKILCQKISQAITKALLYEVSASPKPGLVDRFNNGSHKDMNFFTFIDSACAISGYFEKFAECGLKWEDIDQNSLATIRPLGILCDKEMFEATNGINVHKGAIFSLSIIAACASFCYKKNGSISPQLLCEYAAMVAKPAMNDFENIKTKSQLTNGEKLFQSYGITGIRGEAASGFKSVLLYALPHVKDLDNPNLDKDCVIINTLLSLIANVQDTNIISRKGIDALKKAQDLAKNSLENGGMNCEKGKKLVLQMDKDFQEMGISGGGCADLLAISIALHFLGKI